MTAGTYSHSGDGIGLLAGIAAVVIGAFVGLPILTAMVGTAVSTAPQEQAACAVAVSPSAPGVLVLTRDEETSTRALAELLRQEHPRTVNIPGIGEVNIPAADAHPFDKHGVMAWEAIASTLTGGDGGKFRCDKQRLYYIIRELAGVDGAWVTIAGMDTHNLVSAFFSHTRAPTADVVNGEGIDNDCKPLNGMRYAHP